ncbi:hypothetical protein [Neobacillus sp. NPDC093127]|uniref:hypothetical protein n=1 Tax=Neobacillus sp. NPDC093127 TaxID=3364296 RepID=UPI00381B32F0
MWNRNKLEALAIANASIFMWKRGGAPQKRISKSKFSGDYTITASNWAKRCSAHTAFIGRMYL